MSVDPGSDKPTQPDVAASLPTADESRVREHLANERTYLAWMRTAIALLAFSMLLLRLQIFHPPLVTPLPSSGWEVSLILALVALVAVFLSTRHYLVVRRDIDEDTYEPADRWILLISIVVLLMGAGIIYLVFTAALDPRSYLEMD